MSEVASIAKNLISLATIPTASGYVTFATGATAATTMTADVSAPVFPISYYMVSVYNAASQTTISLQMQNVRSMNGTSVAFDTISTSYTTGETKDILLEGLFAGACTGVRMIFSLGSALTAAESLPVYYQIWPVR